MNKLIVPALLATLCLGGVADASFQTLAQKEARVLKSYRDQPNAEDLVGLSWIREARGKYNESLQTLDLLRRSYGSSRSRAWMNQDDKRLTYGELASWMAVRVKAKRRGIRQASAASKRAAQRSFDKYHASDKNANATLVDLNGDGLKEMVSYIGFGAYLRVHVWNGEIYDSVWQSRDQAGEKVSDDYLITGGEGEDWPSVYVSYLKDGEVNPDSGHVMTNGKSWITIYN